MAEIFSLFLVSLGGGQWSFNLHKTSLVESIYNMCTVVFCVLLCAGRKRWFLYPPEWRSPLLAVDPERSLDGLGWYRQQYLPLLKDTKLAPMVRTQHSNTEQTQSNAPAQTDRISTGRHSIRRVPIVSAVAIWLLA
eukprot:COSAG06_NODE_7350_length_2534_cov_19.102669_2_plen_136_part_00